MYILFLQNKNFIAHSYVFLQSQSSFLKCFFFFSYTYTGCNKKIKLVKCLETFVITIVTMYKLFFVFMQTNYELYLCHILLAKINISFIIFKWSLNKIKSNKKKYYLQSVMFQILLCAPLYIEYVPDPHKKCQVA